MPERWLHDFAWSLATVLGEMVEHNFREEEKAELFAAYYKAIRVAFDAFWIQYLRQQQRMTPSKN